MEKQNTKKRILGPSALNIPLSNLKKDFTFEIEDISMSSFYDSKELKFNNLKSTNQEQEIEKKHVLKSSFKKKRKDFSLNKNKNVQFSHQLEKIHIVDNWKDNYQNEVTQLSCSCYMF